MALYDQGLEFSTNQALTNFSVPTITSATPIDLFSFQNIGMGGLLVAHFEVTEAFTVGSGVPGLQILVTASDDATLASSVNIIGQVGGLATLAGSAPFFVGTALTTGQLIKGAQFYAPLGTTGRASTGQSTSGTSPHASAAVGAPATPFPQGDWTKRYVGATYVLTSFGTGTFAKGKISGRIMLYQGTQTELEAAYPTNYKVGGTLGADGY